ncbi:MAG: DEAD/DEAH box helicase, partial [Kamptonema sp. SIO4C4]|nr:DEAD/DEAH box helicase [Kamptonema sp. SIO4C4]
ITSADAAGWRPSKGELDRYGREIPDEEYQTKDFEKAVSLRMRTEAIAKHITDFMKKTDRFAKTLVFCVDQEHADEMRQLLNNLNSDLVQKHPNYVCRVTADEGGVGKRHLSDFQELETDTPVILTTSQLLTTGVDAPMVKNVALARVVGSISEFKQIIGRGTRVREDYGKLFFSILDYTGAATRHFADPEFDGEPELVTEAVIDDEGQVVEEEQIDDGPTVDPDEFDEDSEEIIIDGDGPEIVEPPEVERRKFYVDGGHVEVAHQVVYEMDASGNQLRVIQYTDYSAEAVRTLFRTVDELRAVWRAPADRIEVIEKLAEKGIDFEHLAELTGTSESDPFDLLCHVAFDAPLRTRRERAERLKNGRKDLFDEYGPEARAILTELLDKYAEHGPAEFKLPDTLRVPPISAHGNVAEIISLFGGPEKLQEAVAALQDELYAA